MERLKKIKKRLQAVYYNNDLYSRLQEILTSNANEKILLHKNWKKINLTFLNAITNTILVNNINIPAIKENSANIISILRTEIYKI